MASMASSVFVVRGCFIVLCNIVISVVSIVMLWGLNFKVIVSIVCVNVLV